MKDGSDDSLGNSGYRIGEFHLLPARRLLLHNGAVVPTGARDLDVLIVLAEEAGRVVPRLVLLARGWPRQSVVENVLGMSIGRLRLIFGALAIATVKGRGFQLTLPVSPLPPDYHPTMTPIRAPDTLPRRREAILGRHDDFDTLLADLETKRLVTLVGTSGIGKSTVAVEVGWLLSESGRYAGGIFLVDLAHINDPADIITATAIAMAVPLLGARPPAKTLADSIKSATLIIYDNCERDSEPLSVLIGGLLSGASALDVLVTSTRPLVLADEHLVRLPGLSFPPQQPGDDKADEIIAFGAVELFLQRVTALDPTFRLTDANAPTVAEICRVLGGVPLALEIIASRVPLLGISRIREIMPSLLDLANLAPRPTACRHDTIRAAIHWSVSLLSPADQTVLCRLSTFAGSFDADAAIVVAGESPNARLGIIDTLGRLIDRSLLTVEPGDRPRFVLLDAHRQFGAECLQLRGETGLMARRHAEHLIALFTAGEAMWETLPEREWRDKFRPEMANAIASLDWAFADPDLSGLSIRLFGALGRAFNRFGLYSAGRSYIDRVKAVLTPETPPAHAALALRRAGGLLHTVDRPRALELLTQAAELFRGQRDIWNLAGTQSMIGDVLTFLGRYVDAGDVLHEADSALAPTTHRKSRCDVKIQLGALALAVNDAPVAREHFASGLDLALAVADSLRENLIRVNLAEAECRAGGLGRAIWGVQAAVSGFRVNHHTTQLPYALINLTSYYLLNNDIDQALTVIEESFPMICEQGGYWLMICLLQISVLLVLSNRHTDAAQLAGFFDATVHRSNEVLQPTERQIQNILVTRLPNASLSPDDIRIYMSDGGRWTEEQAVRVAKQHIALLSTNR